MIMVKVGDKVRFLNAVGGGIVRRIDRDVVLVEEEDGFETPVLARECVVIESGRKQDNDIVRPISRKSHGARRDKSLPNRRTMTTNPNCRSSKPGKANESASIWLSFPNRAAGWVQRHSMLISSTTAIITSIISMPARTRRASGRCTAGER